jgi:hypothetical protein
LTCFDLHRKMVAGRITRASPSTAPARIAFVSPRARYLHALG